MTAAAPARRRLRGRRPADPDGQMTLVEHLTELRGRLVKSLLALAVAIAIAFWQWHGIYGLLNKPYCDIRVGQQLKCQLFTFGPLDQFLIRMRVSLIAGTILSSPVWLYQIGAFITPGLRRHERRWAAGFLAASLVLFAVGVLFAYLTLSKGLQFLLGVGGAGITPLLDVSRYLSFVTLMLLAFGISFEFPVVVVFLNLVGVLTTDRMRAWRRGMIFGIFVFSAVITPSQDPFTFLAMALPLCLLYEGCIVLARVRDRTRRRREVDSGFGPVGDDEISPLDTRPRAIDEDADSLR
ncbi:MAG: twin-arginine translocase subunit TatC [Actinomycetota bacterium]|nr:twin-arginine translocase subunit TatC [Actinomycetota bacterium]